MSDENIKKHEFDEEFLDKLRYFFEDNDPIRMSRNLRMVFFDDMRYQTSGMDVEFDSIMDDIEHLIEMLEVAHGHTKAWRRPYV